MGFTGRSKRYDGFGSSDSIKFLLSDWESNYNRNYRYNKWTTEAVTLPATDDYAIRKYDDAVHYKNNDGEIGLLYYKNPAFVLTLIFLVGVFVLPGIFYLFVKLCLKVDICPSHIRRPSSKGSVQPVNVHCNLPRTRVRNNNYSTNSQTDGGVVTIEDGWSSRISNLHIDTHNNAITQTNISHCLDLNDCFSIRILGQDDDGISSLPPSYEEATRARNTSDCREENSHHNEGGKDTSTNNCSVDEGADSGGGGSGEE